MLSYNVRGLYDDDEALVRVIRAAAPDVVAVQESPNWFRWRPRSAALARRCGLVVLGGGFPAQRNLLLCSVAVRSHGTRNLLLSGRRLPPRGAATALCSLGGSRFGLVGTHLDLVAEHRVTQAKRLLDWVGWLGDAPLVLAGDINEGPGSPAWEMLTARLADAAAACGADHQLTYSATEPVKRIDGIFVDPAIRPVSVEVLDTPDVRMASDHRPVLAELELPG
jgi:endonuclease/exonuclease/phosphatase family metal-dependent hydrolase